MCIRFVSLFLMASFLTDSGGAWAAPREKAPAPERVRVGIDTGLRWLAEKQIKEGPDAGSWESQRYQTAVASFAGLAFLANGYSPGEGDYGAVIDRAMEFVKGSMTPDGYLGARDRSMYAHAIASLFGLSYLGRSADPDKEQELAEWCRKAVNLILEAQQVRKPRLERGGWRYTPFSNDSDLSVTSWQLVVLHAARQSGYRFDAEAIDQAMKYVNRAFIESEKGEAGFMYRVGVSKGPEPAVSGVAVFMKSLFEDETDEKVAKTLEYLKNFPPSWGGPQYKGFFFFGTFYMAQGMFQIGGETWKEFAAGIQKVLLEHQKGDGHWDFPPDNKPQSRPAGTAYTTSLSVLVLSLERQYLPMYLRQKQLF